jgi:hypothetical protein
MSNEVYANGRELSCKAGAGKSTAAFPDVCMTPPEAPPTPPGVPIPYPNTGMTSDTTDGSKTVQISGKEVSLKDSSYFKKSTGDEAGCAAKKGVVTSVNKGKVYFNAWSMDVMIEGENAVRHLDMTTHNHASKAGQTPPWPFVDAQAKSKDPCKKEKEKEQKACKDYKPNPGAKKDACIAAGLGDKLIQSDKDAKKKGFSSASTWADSKAKKANANECLKARRCKLVQYKADKERPEKCCRSQTPDHLVPKSSFYEISVEHGKKLTNWSNYKPNKAPCMCAEGASNTAGSHGLRHAFHKLKGPAEGADHSFTKATNLAAKSAAKVFKASGCSEKCLKAQIKKGHEGMGSGDVKHSPSGSTMTEKEITAAAKAYEAPKTR